MFRFLNRARPFIDKQDSYVAVMLLLVFIMWGAAITWSIQERNIILSMERDDIVERSVAVEQQTLRLLKLADASIIAAQSWLNAHPQADPREELAFIDLVSHLKGQSDGLLDIDLVPSVSRSASPAEGATADGGLLIEAPLRVDGTWTVRVAPLREKASTAQWRLDARINVPRIVALFESQRPRPNGSITVFHADGTTLIRAPAADDDNVISRSIRGSTDFKFFNKAQSGVFRSQGLFDHRERLVSFARLTPYPLIIAVTAGIDDLLLPWRRETAAVHGLAFTVSCLAILFSRRFLRTRRLSNERQVLLEQREEELRLIYDTSWAALFLIDHAGVIAHANRRMAEMFGCTLNQLIGSKYLCHVDESERAESREKLLELFSRGGAVDASDRLYVRNDGTTFTGHLIGQATVSSEGEIGIVGSIIDISERIKTEQDMLLYANVIEGTQEGILITDKNSAIIGVNSAFCKITGYARTELLGQNPRLLKSGRHDRAFYEQMYNCLTEKGHWRGEIWNRRKNGDVYPEWLTMSCLRDNSGNVTNYVATFIDITHIKESEAKLEHLAYYDPLTGLPNRSLLASRLQRALARARRDGARGAVLFVDLDHFKNVNDSMGHSMGDELLRMAAARLTSRLRETDTLARMGGDEFIVILEQLKEPEQAAAVAQSLIDELGQPFVFYSGQEFYLGASIGISIFPDDGCDVDLTVRNADAAMYQAKAAGRNTYRFYTGALTRAANIRVQLEVALRHALEQDEFVLHYQPLVDMNDLRITGVEALLRWQRPGESLVMPNSFIPVAEEAGLIVPLGASVLRKACRQMRAWLDQGVAMETMAVNISAHQLRQSEISQTVEDALRQAGLPARYLELEITETSLVAVGEAVESRLSDLKELGVHISIDDFGTGYSCLSYLKRLPIDKLKVDRSFVCDMAGNNTDLQIVRSIIALAKNLRLEVLAEGIETDTELFIRKRRRGQRLFLRPRIGEDPSSTTETSDGWR